MNTLVLCDDSAHPASLTRDGLAGLGNDCGYEFDWHHASFQALLRNSLAWCTEE